MPSTRRAAVVADPSAAIEAGKCAAIRRAGVRRAGARAAARAARVVAGLSIRRDRGPDDSRGRETAAIPAAILAAARHARPAIVHALARGQRPASTAAAIMAKTFAATRAMALVAALAAGLLTPTAALSGGGHAGAQASGPGCAAAGPQSPRDLAQAAGANRLVFSAAPPAAEMALCNIHLHAPAEHRAPGFALPDRDGWRCGETGLLTERERAPFVGERYVDGAHVGDTIEVHWVFTTCAARPGHGLAACAPAGCANPQLRVEAQAFLLVNDTAAADLADFDLAAPAPGARPRPRALPAEGRAEGRAPVVYLGSTTGTAYGPGQCSPFQVTWSVRPRCEKLHVGSLHRWGRANAFGEISAHGVRPLVTDPALLAPIP